MNYNKEYKGDDFGELYKQIRSHAMIGIIYAIVILIATFLGASAGLGGGVIIKPVLDFIGFHDLNTISFLSTSAVFTMAVYSTIKQIRNKVKFDVMMILLVSIGAMIGGNLGSSMFSALLNVMEPDMITALQSSILALLLIAVLINVNSNVKTMNVKNKIVTFVIGLALGIISSFLGIGGGPINVAVFIFFFSVEMKTATIYSIATILFSQGSKLFTIATTTGFMIFDLSLLFFTLPAAILGGVIGTMVNKRADEQIIRKIFSITVVAIIILNIYNAVMVFI